MARIEKIFGREVLDSRGNPTVETDVTLEGGILGRFMVPSGASKGIYEAVEIRDGGKRFLGEGVQRAVKAVSSTINKAVSGKDIRDQKELDQVLLKLDGTKNKSKLGANAILSVSIAFARALAQAKKQPLAEYVHEILPANKMCLPVPFSNIINGGKHAGTSLKFQEFMIAPHGAKSFAHATQITSEIYHSLKVKISLKYGKSSINVGDEGGFTPPITKPEEALVLLEETIESLGYRKETGIAMDVAASEFFENGKYNLEKPYSGGELIDYYTSLIKSFGIISIEDPFDQDDFSSFAALTKKVGRKVQIVGDDLLTTNTERIRKAIKEKACVALLLKVNQIGTLTEALDAAKMAFDANWNVMVSHRSGETEDAFIADLAVGIGCGQIKLGAPCRGERCSKFNQLLRLEELMKGKAQYWRPKSA